jgi:hypothetical protein
MKQHLCMALLLSTTLAGSELFAAEQDTHHQKRESRPSAERKGGADQTDALPSASKAFGRLRFGAGTISTSSSTTAQSRAADVRSAPQTRVVCGMTVHQADPSVDPKFIIPIPENMDYKMRRITPPACVE